MLDKYRNEIDTIDDELIKLLEKRFEVTNEIGVYKRTNNIAVLNKKRENDIYQKIAIQNLKYKREISSVFESLIKISKEQQGE